MGILQLQYPTPSRASCPFSSLFKISRERITSHHKKIWPLWSPRNAIFQFQFQIAVWIGRNKKSRWMKWHTLWLRNKMNNPLMPSFNNPAPSASSETKMLLLAPFAAVSCWPKYSIYHFTRGISVARRQVPPTSPTCPIICLLMDCLAQLFEIECFLAFHKASPSLQQFSKQVQHTV